MTDGRGGAGAASSSGADGREGGSAGAPAGGRAAGVAVWIAVLAFAAWLLHVPLERIPMLYDTLGYASQAASLLDGEGNTITVGAERVPGIYPAGMPALAAAAMAVRGDDVRHGVAAVWCCALLVLVGLGRVVGRLATGAGLVAGLLLLGSPVFRMTSGWLLSQVPTALAVVLVTALYLRSWRGGVPATGWLVAAGVVAALSVLLRFAHAAFPVALGLAELLLGGRRVQGARIAALAALAGGGLLGAAGVLLHNAWAFGGPFVTGYALWGFDLGDEMSLRHLVEIPDHWGIDGQWPLTTSFLGLNRAFTPVVTVAAVVGAWRSRAAAGASTERVAFATLAVLGIVFDAVLLGLHSFHSDLYLVPLLPLTMGLAALGLHDLFASWARRRAAADDAGGLSAPGASRVPAIVAAALLALSLVLGAPTEPGVDGALLRFGRLEQAAARLPDDAVVLTANDPALVDPLVRRGSAREIVYVPDYVSPLVGDAVARQLGVDEVTVETLVAHVGRRLAEGRPVYLDQNPPPRELSDAQRALRPALNRRFVFEPDETTLVYRLLPESDA